MIGCLFQSCVSVSNDNMDSVAIKSLHTCRLLFCSAQSDEYNICVMSDLQHICVLCIEIENLPAGPLQTP